MKYFNDVIFQYFMDRIVLAPIFIKLIVNEKFKLITISNGKKLNYLNAQLNCYQNEEYLC